MAKGYSMDHASHRRVLLTMAQPAVSLQAGFHLLLLILPSLHASVFHTQAKE